MTTERRPEQRYKKKGRSDELGIGGYVLSPMWATLKTLLRGLKGKPRTVIYPYEETDTPEFWKGKKHYWRGMHRVDWSRCIGCGLCSRVCPTRCITMENIPEEEAGKFLMRSKQDEKKKKVDRPGVDVGRCSFCGYCEEVCPVDAWRMTNKFDLANKDRKAIIFSAKRLRSKKRRGRPRRITNKIRERPVFLFDKCKGCQACIRNCSVGVIDLVDMGRDERNKPLRRIFIRYKDCIGCAACVTSCKFKSLYMEREDKARNDPRVLNFLKEARKKKAIEAKAKG